ncbi:MAG: hypothetical protein IKI82_02485 [Lachnospiraceae bacterium]|jgi:hypothetical protein|nr:hypothetical protein [Lachnospiraceae bacterium]
MAGRFREKRQHPIQTILWNDSIVYRHYCPASKLNTISKLFHSSHCPKREENKECLSPAHFSGTAQVRGSLTVEAALALPLFLLLCSLFFTFFSGQIWQLRLQNALDEVCEDVAVWSYLVDFAEDYTGADLLSLADGGRLSGALEGRTEDILPFLRGEADLLEEIKLFLAEKGSALLWQPLLTQWICGKVGRDALRASPIAGKDGGLSLSGSSLHDRELDLVLSYEIESPLRFPLALRYPVVQRSCRRLWIGTKVDKKQAEEEDEEEEEGICYVTAYGSVYHTTKSCRVLALKIMTVEASQLPSLRNTSGGKYYPCDRCARNKVPEGTTVIVTEPGTRYHFRQDCPSLKRTIQEISEGEAKEKYRPCHYCGGDDS